MASSPTALHQRKLLTSLEIFTKITILSPGRKNLTIPQIQHLHHLSSPGRKKQSLQPSQKSIKILKHV